MQAMSSESVFNLVEGLWWIGLGVWILRHGKLTSRTRLVTLSNTLICFGISDFVEIFTGAWWRPLWLLAFKAVCLAAGIITSILIYIERRRPWKQRQSGSN